MKDRIQQLIDYKGISGGEFAEKLGVQRSNVSHILNGRNKPGAVFLEKILHAYPELNARWLLTGQGNMMHINEPVQPSKNAIVEEKNQQQQLFPPITKPIASSPIEEEKEIEKIVLLYSDGTFSYYNYK